MLGICVLGIESTVEDLPKRASVWWVAQKKPSIAICVTARPSAHYQFWALCASGQAIPSIRIDMLNGLCTLIERIAPM